MTKTSYSRLALLAHGLPWVRSMDNVTTRHTANTGLCRCSRCTRDRLVLTSLSPRIARVLRQAIASSR